MSNKTATFRGTISYSDVDGQSVTIPQFTIAAPYQAQNHGTFDIPDSTAAGDFVIPFGSIERGMAVLLVNHTGQDLAVQINGGDLAYLNLSDGKAFVASFEAMPGGAPISAITVTTGQVQAGAGSVAYHIWGDPV